jgi:hypothetical protein
MNIISKLSLLAASILLKPGLTLKAQTNFWKSPQAYLGQNPPGDEPVKFAPLLINDTPFFSLGRSAFSSDGKEFYYCRNNTWFSVKDATIQVYKFDGSKWKGPMAVIKQLYAPTFSPQGNSLYLQGGGSGVITRINRTATGWSEPETFLKRSYGLYDFMPTKSGNMYAASNINGKIRDFTCYDICIMRPLAAGDTNIHSLGKPLNTPGFDGDFFVASDESYIVVSAKEQLDYECEIYISYHKKDGTWTNPKSLGSKINNGPAHRWGEYVTPDNKYLFYSYGHGPQDCAIYWVRFDDLLEKLRHSNFEPYVKDSISNQTTGVGKNFSLHFGDTTFYDDDGNNTLTYSASLADSSSLPAWLHFNPATKMFAGKPSSPGIYHLRLMATDPEKAMAECSFSIKVVN